MEFPIGPIGHEVCRMEKMDKGGAEVWYIDYFSMLERRGYGKDKGNQNNYVWRHRSWAAEVRQESGRGVDIISTGTLQFIPHCCKTVPRPQCLTFWHLLPLRAKAPWLCKVQFSLLKCEKIPLYVYYKSIFKSPRMRNAFPAVHRVVRSPFHNSYHESIKIYY